MVATVLPHEDDAHLQRLGCFFHKLDVTDQESIEVLAEYIEDIFVDGLDVLVNNA